MYIPDEWEPSEWDEITGKQDRKFSARRKSLRCPVPMGASGERGDSLHVPDMPGELDGYGNRTATQVRKSKGTACLVVQSPAEEETESTSESRPRSTASGFLAPLPEIAEADEENAGCVLADSGSQ